MYNFDNKPLLPSLSISLSLLPLFLKKEYFNPLNQYCSGDIFQRSRSSILSYFTFSVFDFLESLFIKLNKIFLFNPIYISQLKNPKHSGCSETGDLQLPQSNYCNSMEIRYFQIARLQGSSERVFSEYLNMHFSLRLYIPIPYSNCKESVITTGT